LSQRGSFSPADAGLAARLAANIKEAAKTASLDLKLDTANNMTFSFPDDRYGRCREEWQVGAEPDLNRSFIWRSCLRTYRLAMLKYLFIAGLTAVSGLLATPPAVAEPGREFAPGIFDDIRSPAMNIAGDDQNSARDATKAGKIKPLPEILAVVKKKVPGRVVDVQLSKKKIPWIYRVKVLTKSGKVVRVFVNAETANIVRIKGKR
jgi:hypothetical protein